MPERRLSDPLVNVLGPLDGARVPGGCDCCAAVQTVRAQEPGVWVVEVLHDDGCPVLLKAEGRL